MVEKRSQKKVSARRWKEPCHSPETEARKKKKGGEYSSQRPAVSKHRRQLERRWNCLCHCCCHWSSLWLVVVAVAIVGCRWLLLLLSLSSLSVVVVVSQPSVITIVDVSHLCDCDRHATSCGRCTLLTPPLGPLFSLG